MIVALIISCLALLIGPALFAAERERPAVLSFLDGFVILTIGSIVLLHVIPEALEAAGWIAVPVALLGLVLPTLTEKLELQSHQGTHGLAIVLAMVALFIHTFIDGFAIGNHGVSANLWLLMGIVLHRIPVGMVIWLLIRPEWGTRGAIGAIVMLMVGTAIGAGMATSLPILAGSTSLALFQVFVAGSLLHVLFHQPHDHAHDHHGHDHAHDHHAHGHPAAAKTSQIPAVLGAIAGLALIYLLGHLEAITVDSHAGHSHHHHGIGPGVGELLIQAMTWLAFVSPLYLLGLAFSEMCAQLLIKDMVAPAMRPFCRAVASTTCSCGAVPQYRNGTARGDRYAEAALFASMLCSGSFLLVSLGLLATPLAVALFLSVAFIAGVLAIAGARLFAGSGSKGSTDDESADIAPPPLAVLEEFNLATAWERTLERFDRDGPWLLASAFIAATILAGGLSPISTLSVPVQVLLCMVLALPFYIPGAPAVVLALSMLAVGISPAACIVFVIASATLHVRVLQAIRDERGGRYAAAWFALASGGMLACAAILSAVLGLGARTEMLRFWATVSTGDVHAGLHLNMTNLPTALLIACAIAGVVVLTGIGRSLLTRGPREWFSTMLNGHH